MLTLVAILFLPAVFVMSIYRLYQLPRDVLAGSKWLNSEHRLVYALASASTYLALGACTTYLAYAIVAYFSASWTAFQADRGRHFSVMVDGVSV